MGELVTEIMDAF